MHIEIFIKEQCINTVHYVAIDLTLFSFSLKVLKALMAITREYVSFAHFFLCLFLALLHASF